MRICWFAEFHGTEGTHLDPLLAATPGLDEALIHRAASTHDPYLDDGPPPSLALQLYFRDIAALEAALSPTGHLQALPAALPGVTRASQQAMLARAFPVPDPVFATPGQACTYLVAYQGSADDLNAWLDYYLRSHPPIMARFPAIRAIEICTRIDWIGFLPFPRVAHMQRNKVVFDDQAALTAALNSPVRHEMRDDFKNFPPFTGPNTHFPMNTTSIRPA